MSDLRILTATIPVAGLLVLAATCLAGDGPEADLADLNASLRGLAAGVDPEVRDLWIGYLGGAGHVHRDLGSGGASSGPYRESGAAVGCSRTLAGVAQGWSPAWVADLGLLATRTEIANANGSTGRETGILATLGGGPTWCISASSADRIELSVAVEAGAGYAAYGNDYHVTQGGLGSDTSIDADGAAFEVGARMTGRWLWSNGLGCRLDLGLVRRQVRLDGSSSTQWANGAAAASGYRSSDEFSGCRIGFAVVYRR